MRPTSDKLHECRVIGRYVLHAEIAAGGMASVHFGQLLGPVGFVRTVAIKRLHPQYAKDPEFVSMFLDEARIAARIRHPYVIPTLDVVAVDQELFLVMEYVQGESLSHLLRSARARSERVPIPVVLAIMSNVLQGLDAAHETVDESGMPLRIVHRDMSPQNVLVGVDGVARVLDFGIAKAVGRLQSTTGSRFKGKLRYTAPEQLTGSPVTRSADIYSAAVVLWEMLTGQRISVGSSDVQTLMFVVSGKVKSPREVVPELPEELDRIVMRGLEKAASERFSTAREMAVQLEQCGRVATPMEVGEWVMAMAGGALAQRIETVTKIEQSLRDGSANHVNAFMDQLRSGQSPTEWSQPGLDPALAGRQSFVSVVQSMTLNGSADVDDDFEEGLRRHKRQRTIRMGLAAAAIAGFVGATMVVVHLRKPGEPPTSVAVVSTASGSTPPLRVSTEEAPSLPSASSTPSTSVVPTASVSNRAPVRTFRTTRPGAIAPPPPPKTKGKGHDGLFDRD